MKLDQQKVFDLLGHMLKATERVSFLGIVLPLLHFAILPVSLFAYVHAHIVKSGGHVIDTAKQTVTLTVQNTDFIGFYWLADFWLKASAAALILFAMYKICMHAFSSRIVSRVFFKALLAVVVTSGQLERFIANNFMAIGPKYAPKFEFSLYRDLGELVRGQSFEFGSHSWFSAYSWLPLLMFALTMILYSVVYIYYAVKISLKNSGPTPR